MDEGTSSLRPTTPTKISGLPLEQIPPPLTAEINADNKAFFEEQEQAIKRVRLSGEILGDF